MRPSNPIRCGGFPELLAKVEARDKMSLSTRLISKLDESTNPLIPTESGSNWRRFDGPTKYHRFDPLQLVGNLPRSLERTRDPDEVPPI